jgi:hypothetical protein
MPITRFTKQEAISALNKALPPSSTAIHNPGLLSELLQLTHEFMGPGWGCDQLRWFTFTSGVGVTTIASDVVPVGKYRYVLACHGVSLAMTATSFYGLVIFDSITSLDAYIVPTFPIGGGSTPFAIGTVGVVAVAPRPFVVPPNGSIALNATSADAGRQLMLRYCGVDLDIGEPPPIRF